MARVHDPDRARSALTSRLTVAYRALIDDDVPEVSGDPSRDAALLLDCLVTAVHAEVTEQRLWLLFVAVASAYPTPDDIADLRRSFELSAPDESAVALLKAGFAVAAAYGAPESEMRLVTDTVLVDVDFAARHELHTGIQRVVRSTVPLWLQDKPVTLAAWTNGYGAYRELRETEEERVSNWGDARVKPRAGFTHAGRSDAPILLAPWGTAVVLAEVPDRSACTKLAALAAHSPNKLTAIGYDCIPIVSADLLPPVEPNRFVHYLAALKVAHAVAGISASATAEFAGFASMLSAQGLPGPLVFECVLPAPASSSSAEPSAWVGAGSRPVVMCVGSFEPRKNQIAVLHAAELLWRDGLKFELVFVGGGGSSAEMKRRVAQLSRKGRPVRTRTGISEAELGEAYRQARFTVFPSLHEGYGLPVVESLAQGTPVLTTDYGSPAEIAVDGGTLLVDPRDDRAIAEGMRTLLTNDAVLAKLTEQIALRPARTWVDYAEELWVKLVEPAAALAAAQLPGAGLSAASLSGRQS